MVWRSGGARRTQGKPVPTHFSLAPSLPGMAEGGLTASAPGAALPRSQRSARGQPEPRGAGTLMRGASPPPGDTQPCARRTAGRRGPGWSATTPSPGTSAQSRARGRAWGPFSASQLTPSRSLTSIQSSMRERGHRAPRGLRVHPGPGPPVRRPPHHSGGEIPQACIY